MDVSLRSLRSKMTPSGHCSCGAASGILALPNVKNACSRRGIVPLTRQPSHREGHMPIKIGRRELIAALGASAWPLGARAQQRERVRRIGVLIGTAEDDPE
jgi:hypothetical protein